MSEQTPLDYDRKNALFRWATAVSPLSWSSRLTAFRLRQLFPFLGAALAVVLAGCAHFPPQNITPGEHVILCSDLSTESAQEVQQEADRTVRGVSEFFGLNPPTKRTRILLFGSGRLLRRYLEQESPHLAGHAVAGACFVTEEASIVAVSERWRTAETLRYLRHELTHSVLAAHYAHLPPWIDEGLALFFELGPPYGRPHPARLKALRRQLGGNKEELLSRLVALPEGVHLNSLQYAQAWGLTHFLLTDARYGVGPVKEYLAAVNSGADAREQFPRSFGRSPAEMEPSWREHVVRLYRVAASPASTAEALSKGP